MAYTKFKCIKLVLIYHSRGLILTNGRVESQMLGTLMVCLRITLVVTKCLGNRHVITFIAIEHITFSFMIPPSFFLEYDNHNGLYRNGI